MLFSPNQCFPIVILTTDFWFPCPKALSLSFLSESYLWSTVQVMSVLPDAWILPCRTGKWEQLLSYSLLVLEVREYLCWKWQEGAGMGRGKAGRESKWAKKHQVPTVELFCVGPSGRIWSKEGWKTRQMGRNHITG